MNFFKTSSPMLKLLEFKVQVLVDMRPRTITKINSELDAMGLDQENNSAITKIDQTMLPVFHCWYRGKEYSLENITHYFESISSLGFRSVLFVGRWQNVVRFDVSCGVGILRKFNCKEFMNKAHEKI
jgi:hypothetical protein